jgi:hypothetical protein
VPPISIPITMIRTRSTSSVLDGRGAIVLRQKWSRGQVEARLANMPSCLIGMEACVGAHHLSCKLKALGHDARLMPAKYVRPYSKGQKNNFHAAEAIAEAVQRPTMKFVATICRRFTVCANAASASGMLKIYALITTMIELVGSFRAVIIATSIATMMKRLGGAVLGSMCWKLPARCGLNPFRSKSLTRLSEAFLPKAIRLGRRAKGNSDHARSRKDGRPHMNSQAAEVTINAFTHEIRN